VIGPVLFFLLLWVVAGLATFWWGTRTPQPGTRRLVRTCGRRIAFVGSEVPVDLWPSAQGLPARQAELRSHRVVLVLDHSGSMGSGPGSGLEAARSAALSFVHGSFSEHCLIGIVAFDDGASVLAPVGAGLEAVAGGLLRIRPGGGTSIAAGLEAAGRALGETPGRTADAQEVVLLLSDGGSAEEPALAEARRLKERGARVMTIGLGRGVNRRLLAALASSEEDFSHTLNPQHLARLYEAAASALEGDRGFRAQIEESVSAARFAIAGYGEVQPYVVDGVRGTLRWFLPFVAERPGRRASYRLIARRWGWHRVASRPARIEMFGHDGQPYEGTSNSSPHVLVLPRLAWPFWLLFLNPLFWMIASRLGLGRGDAPEVRQPPTPRPVPLPDVWQPRLPGASSTTPVLTPALLVGVGQTGGLILRALSFHLATLPPGAAQDLRLLWVDTGPEPAGAGDDEAELGPPIALRDRVLLPDNLEPLFRRRRQTLSPEPHLAWLDAGREMETLRPQDFDLSRGTHGRRVLGRAALYRHLEEPRPALREAFDERLRSLPSGYRVIVMGNLAGGTGGGMLLDLLVYLKKRMRRTGNPPRSTDLLLLTHRAGGDRGSLEPIELESSQAFAVELGRMLFQGNVPLSYPQEPGETPADREVRRFLDRVLVMEQPLEDTQGAPCWPGPAAHAAAQVLFQILATPGAGADAFLEESRKRLRQSERSSGQPMVFAVGSAWRSLPVPQAREMLVVRAVRDYMARDLLGLEASGDRLVIAHREDVEKAGRLLAVDLLAGQGLTRALPELLDALEPLAEAESVGAELGRRLQDLDFLSGSSVRIDFAGDALLAQVLDTQQGLFDALLQEWVLEHLNGRPRENGALDPAARRGALPQLVAAVGRLAALSGAAVANLQGVEPSVRKQGLGARINFLIFLIGRYHQSIKTMDRHLATWWQALAPDPEAPWNQGTSLTAVVARAAADASRRLSRLADRLRPSVCWSPEIEQRLVERYAEPVRDRLGERVLWHFEPVSGDPAPCPSLCVGDPQKSWSPAGIEDLREDLEKAALALGLTQIEDERLDNAFDLSAWLAPGTRRDPVRFEANRQAEASAAAQRREFLLASPGMAIPGRQTEDLTVSEGGGRHGSSIVRVLSPCALAAVGGLSDAERHTAGRSHAALPWLDPVDRRAAEQEDMLPRTGLQARFLGPLLRVHFQEPDRLRTFVTASCLAMIERSIVEDVPVLSLCGHRLTGEDRDTGEALVLEALDHFCREGRTAPPDARPIDLQQVAAAVERRLAATDDGDLVQRSRGAAELVASLLDGCPGRTADDFIGLVRLTCELELERRRRRQGGAA
jgi:uncharacterized protein YegL